MERASVLSRCHRCHRHHSRGQEGDSHMPALSSPFRSAELSRLLGECAWPTDLGAGGEGLYGNELKPLTMEGERKNEERAPTPCSPALYTT